MERTVLASLRSLVERLPHPRPESRSYPWLVLAATGLGILMPVLDTTIVNVAIAKLQISFGESTDAVQWVITAYLLVYAVTLATSGWLADRFGYKRVFIGGVACFTLGSFLCSISPSLGTLIVSRLIQGMGGSMIVPVSMALVTREFKKERLGLAIAIWSIPALAATSFGPTLGGWLIDHFSWQTMFDINVPIGLLSLAVCGLVLRERRSADRQPFDVLGFGSLAVAIAALLLGLADGNAEWNTDGWGSTFILSCFGISAASFVLFLICQATTSHPVIDFSLFRIYNFGLSAIVLFIFGLGVFGSDFLLPLYLQNGLGYSPTQAGLVFIPYGFIMIVCGALGGRLTDRLGAKLPGILGILLRAAGMLRFASLSPDSGPAQIFSAVCLLATGMGFLMSPLQTVALASIPEEKTAQGSSLIKIVQQIGGSFGVALLSTMLVDRQKFHMANVGTAMGARAALLGAALSKAAPQAMESTGGSLGTAVSQVGAAMLARVRTEVFVWAIDDVFLIALAVSVLSSLPFMFIKSSPRRRERPASAPRPVAEGAEL